MVGSFTRSLKQAEKINKRVRATSDGLKQVPIMQLHGIIRIKHPTPAEEDGVWISDGILGFEVSEEMYRERKYGPPLESLPWRARAGRTDPEET